MVQQIIQFLNAAVSRGFELVMAPIAHWPLFALVLWSIVTGIVMAWLFRWTSNQKGIGRAADRSRAEMLAINLFQDDIVGVFGSLGRLLVFSLMRIAYSLPAVIVIIGPLLFLLAQLAGWYEWRPLPPDQDFVIELRIDRRHWQESQDAQLIPPAGAKIEAGPLRDVGQLALYWRLRPAPMGDDAVRSEVLQWKLDGQLVEKRIEVSGHSRPLVPVSPLRAGSSWLDQILYPVEPALPRSGPVSRIEIYHARRSTPILGWDIPWWLTFFIVSMVAAIAVKPWVGVRF
jgi:hypothetical protein